MAHATRSPAESARAAKLAVLVAALGYFVDIYDLLLFSIVRKPSLVDLGVAAADQLEQGVLLINTQMGGMLLGGIFWGVLADRRGRLSVLFGSIAMYSLANIANAFVTTVDQYAALRFIAGIGLAGELGAGITLVSESLGRENRGYGTTVVAGVGITGAVAAALVGGAFSWRVAYGIGGGLGVALLLLRIGVMESGMYAQTEGRTDVKRGDFLALFARANRLKRYVSVIVVGIPIWFSVGILVTFSPELGKAMGMTELPDAGRAVMWMYVGLALGDFGSGALSQLAKSRKKVIGLFLVLTALMIGAYFTVASSSLTTFYAVVAVLGFANGYWAVFVTVASEQFGTNIRATATTTVPNFVRGMVVPLTTGFRALQPGMGSVQAAMVVGAISMLLAGVALFGLEETYGKELDYVE